LFRPNAPEVHAWGTTSFAIDWAGKVIDKELPNPRNPPPASSAFK
jgi:hypothetical protein